MICDECESYEYKRDHPLRWMMRAAQVWLLTQAAPKPSPVTLMLRSMGSLLGAMSGSAAPPTHYERHRNEWVRTGSRLELQRMLRQVGPDG